MKITLMNKNTPLMSLDIDIKTSYVKEILKIHNAEPMPISVYSDDETTLGENFTQWWNVFRHKRKRFYGRIRICRAIAQKKSRSTYRNASRCLRGSGIGKEISLHSKE